MGPPQGRAEGKENLPRPAAHKLAPRHGCWAHGTRRRAPCRAQTPLPCLGFRRAAATTSSFQQSLPLPRTPGQVWLPVPSPAAARAAGSPGCSVQQTGRASRRQQSVPGDGIGLDVPPDRSSAVACSSPKAARLSGLGEPKEGRGEKLHPQPSLCGRGALQRCPLAAPDAMGRCLCARSGGCDP